MFTRPSVHRCSRFLVGLELDPDAEEPLTVTRSRRVELRAWTRADLAPALAAADFDAVFHGVEPSDSDRFLLRSL